MKCFYHSADLDGHCSGAVVLLRFPHCEMIGFNYGQKFPWESIDPKEDVVMVDVSLPIAEMVELARMLRDGGGQLIWIDHHVGIIRDHSALLESDRGLFWGTLDTSKAACELCWEYFHDGIAMPATIERLGVYDSWRFSEEQEGEVKAFQYGMRLAEETRPERNIAFWADLFADDTAPEMFDVIQKRGWMIFAYQTLQNEKAARAMAFETELKFNEYEIIPEHEPLRCIAVNSNLMNSDVFKSVYDPEKHDAMLCFYRSNRGFWRCSIYSTHAHIDCSVYAKSYDGGGHKGAAGFKWVGELLPFELASVAR